MTRHRRAAWHHAPHRYSGASRALLVAVAGLHAYAAGLVIGALL